MKTNVLIIDDDNGFIEDVKNLMANNIVVFYTHDPDTGIEILKNEAIETVLLDIDLSPKKNGIEYIGKIKKHFPYMPIIMVSYHDEPDFIIEALQKGASDYVPKLIPYDKLKAKINKSIINYRIHKNFTKENNLIFKSPTITKIFHEINKIASTDFTICLTGESGVGKSAIAKYIHEKSNRSSRNFVNINIPSIPESLFESELFGHVKGAFTGADKDKVGKIEFADGGTVFLDEISETSIQMQAKLLRLLEDKEYERIGDIQTRRADIRIISATNKNLIELVETNKFRKDLFYRISTITINIPPLRERKEDVTELLDFYTEKIGIKVLGKKISLSKEAKEAL